WSWSTRLWRELTSVSGPNQWAVPSEIVTRPWDQVESARRGAYFATIYRRRLHACASAIGSLPMAASANIDGTCEVPMGNLGLTRFSGHLSVYREGVSNGEQRNEVSSGVSQADGRIGLGGPQIR